MNNVLLWLYSVFLFTTPIHTGKVVLKDDRGNSEMSPLWQKKPFPKHGCDNSWALEDNYWYTCFAKISQNQKCLLETGVYDLKNLVNSVYVNISTKTESCKKRGLSSPVCNDFFTLRYKKSQSKDEITKVSDFTVLDKMPNEDVPGDNTHFNSQHLFTIKDVKNTAYIKFGFVAENYCGEIISFGVFKFNCPAKTGELVDFPSTSAPSEGESPDTINGRCAANSVPEPQHNVNPYIKCYSNGSYEVFGKCRCNAGYFKKEKQCQACGSSGFKLNVGNEACTSCGKYSFSTSPHKSCICDKSYLREVGKTEDSAVDCYRPPSKPQGLEAKNIKSNSVKLEWKAPKYGITTGANTDYVINCINCSVNDKFPLRTKQREIILANLGSFAPYTLKVSMQNTITKKVNVVNAEEVSFKTLVGKPGKVERLKTRFQADGSAVVEWEAPFSKGAADLSYRVTYGSKSVSTRKPSFTIESGAKDETHQIKVYAVAKTSTGEIFVGEPQTITVKTSGGVDLGVTIGAVMGVMVLLVIVFIVFLHFWRKRHPMYTQVVRMEDGTIKMNGGKFLQPGKFYVDPTTYNNVDDAVKDFAKEMKIQDLEIGTLLGGGAFGEVYKGKLTKNGKVIDVAVKQLKTEASKEDKDDFLSEAAILGQFSHKNVIQMEGFIKQGHSTSQTTSYVNTENTTYENQMEIRLIVLEYMKNGALETFLQQNDTQFAVLELLGMARGVSSGMKYLSEMGFIHRDLAARNILVDEHRTCKVADFGMSRKIDVDDIYDSRGGKIPIRWTAPEAIEYRRFTSASDVWSFGILLWEIMSFGQRPYAELTNGEVLERIISGYRLPPPMNCPKVVHNLMLECWSRDRLKRPKFSGILATLENWIRNPATSQIGVSVEHEYNKMDHAVLQNITKWLEAINMERYAGNFLEKGYATPRHLVDLNLEDLEELGVGPIGHRRKIFKGIQKSKGQQLYYGMNEVE